MSAAARYASEAGAEGMSRAQTLAHTLRKKLGELDQVKLSDRGSQKCAIVTLALKGWDAERLKLKLRTRGLHASASLREDGVLDMD